jgi:predicted ATPase/DNA-binding SARP family transcriptional activator
MGIQVGVLGPLEVRDADGQPLPVGGSRLRSLVIRLAITDGRAVPVDQLTEDLWPGDGPADAPNAVQALVSRLRGVAGRDIVAHGPAGYRLAVPSRDIDAVAFERLVADGRARLAEGNHGAAAEVLRAALALWRGSALADVADAAFAAGTIARLSELRLAATEDRIDADLALGRGAELVPEVEELVAEHPLRERLRGQLMRALQVAGRQADALRVFDDTRQRLASELGMDPSPALSSVHLAVLRGELPAAATPVRDGAPVADGPITDGPITDGTGAGPTWRQGNLPAQLTSFVGRDDELGRLGSMLGETRLITLTGPGGAGKTRLSVEAGARVADQVRDGVWFVPLSPVRDAAEVPQAVLVAIGAYVGSALTPVEAARLAAMEPLEWLTEMLAARSLLLVLDNCEHVLDAVARLAGRVLAQAPGVRILATSREPIGLTGETLFPVPSLPLPAEDADAGQAAGSPAVRLFADRAAAVRPGFRVDAETAGSVVRICRALDGIPLAIELAAARVRALTPAQVADRLDDRFALLSVGTRNALPRHQTLRAIVDWSWELLDDVERTVLRRLSVFSGGAAPESAEQVCSLGAERDAVVDVIASLVDKSLVTAVGEREVRYRLLETVRAYAAERLAEAGEADEVAAAHAECFLALAERAEPELRSRDQLAWLNRLTAEHDNFSAALHHVAAAGDAAAVLRFVGALAWFWITRDYDAEAAEWAGRALRLAGDSPPPGLADAYAIATMVNMISGVTAKHGVELADQPEQPGQALPPQDVFGVLERLSVPPDTRHPLLAVAAPMLAGLRDSSDTVRRNLEQARDHSDPWVRAARRALAGHLADNDGDIESAAEELTEAYSLFSELGDRWGLIVCLAGLADVAIARGQAGEAVRLLEEARGYASEGLATNWGQTMRVAIGRARARAGDIDGARADLDYGVRFAEQIGEFDDVAAGYIELAEIARSDGDLAGAHDLLLRAAQIAEQHSRPAMPVVAATALSRLGSVAEQEGDLAAAASLQQRALSTLTRITTPMLPLNRTLAVVVEGIAALAAARGEPARAAELLGLAHTLRGFCDDASPEVARAKAGIDAALDVADADAAYARGRKLGPADALALTL